MAPFWSGIAIGLGICLTVALAIGALWLIIYLTEWLAILIGAAAVTARDGMRAERARLDMERAKVGLGPLNRRRQLALNLRRSWRIARHPIRERALLAESFRALKSPATHRWSDDLS